MNTKFCKVCGKELPVEATFCPYCMTKLIDVKTGEPLKVKKKKPIVPIVIILLVAIITIGAVLFIVFNGNFGKDISKETTATTEATETSTQAQTQPTTEATMATYGNYSSYIGLWCDKDSDINNMTENGGNLLEIISVKDDVVRFTFTKTSSAPHNRIARISNVTSQIIDGVGTFTFDDDNWLNSGTGKIKLLDDEIYIETTILNSQDSNAMWDIGGSFYLTKAESSIIDFKNYDYLGEDFDNVKNLFGEEIPDGVDVTDGVETHYYNGFQVSVNQASNKIKRIIVNYQGVPMSKSNLCYGEINGNSTYDDVYYYLGEPVNNRISENFVEYNIKEGTLSISFDNNMNVTSFALISN